MPDADMSGGGFDPMSADPNIGAGIGNMAEDPSGGMPAGDPGMEGMDPSAGMSPEGETGMENVDPNLGSDAEVNDDSTASIIDQLSDDDKEAVRNYAKSLLNRDETQGQEDMDMMGGEDPNAVPVPGQEPGVMMEITKGRLKKVQQRLHETFRSREDDKDEIDRNQKKVHKKHGKKSPFDSPLN